MSIFKETKSGLWVARCSACPKAIAYGATENEAIRNAEAKGAVWSMGILYCSPACRDAAEKEVME